ncbi:hypothetical protein ACH4YO_10330 [Streptomyces noursei]|uniref:hypothetical protein n=1 Tax=Streptomyces noursei TaxID=1971 RepID=UPI00167641A8|nr:hypothetical protein [Streptomyces noursei]MCZ1016426.1 hypothetical protein [Streptomyces noursei]GGW99746.1 hypothetical protein GCM10010341_21760 [Streptomyces noursei]
MDESLAARLLPWSGPDGKPCYLVSDGGYVSRVADGVEAVQLNMADDLLAHADGILDERLVSPEELRFLARRLKESLRDVRRVAESRGARLPLSDDDPEGDGSDSDEDGSPLSE